MSTAGCLKNGSEQPKPNAECVCVIASITPATGLPAVSTTVTCASLLRYRSMFGSAIAFNYTLTDDFYADWAGASFGPKVGGEIAAIFARLDSHLPRPGDWITGPGVISPDSLPWEVAAAHYRFVDELEALAGKVEGPGNRQRYEYWLNIFRLLRSIAHVRCDWGRYNAAIENVKAEKAPTVQGQLARAAALPFSPRRG